MTDHDAPSGAQPRAWAVSIQVGEALWRGRLRAGLSLDEVARRIGVDPKIVGALENSDFASLPERAATIAAARAYAQVVGLSKKWVMRALDEELKRLDAGGPGAG
ncbi:MAG TPA: helix-turn-helix domain-containing protein [Sphingomonas sp.]